MREKVGVRLLASYALNLADMAFTIALVNAFGISIEANPIGRLILAGNLSVILVKVIGFAVAMGVLYVFRTERVTIIGSYVILGAYSLLNVYHIIIMAVLTIS